ncbi:YifB family Mg chelatase-like AAA ATPase [Hippea maritima]|uniref:Mg chelatase, subunit ChlI n=1 Tax=Hippea maritima (strain ATCC 700847 / DSM 10411 / MH2) TaxID=760142 RepID=F2LW52_HIPMA|nr:YifB family Mg chelatase-like AAA ATPase [Hippea maritima]AEA33986.1 Mg chelatase, subunit ChlI [Hippea maritima DSM 10411]
MFVKLNSALVVGIEARPVTIEIDATRGLPSLNIIGLAQGAAKESKDRAIHALSNSGIKLPPKKITISLAPADLKKEGSGFDLPIAVGLSIISLDLKLNLDGYLFASELSLDGKLRGINGIFPIGVFAKEKGLKLIVSKDNAKEAALTGACVFGFDHLLEVLSFLKGEIERDAEKTDIDFASNYDDMPDFSSVKGQLKVKRAVIIAVAGFHNILLVGPPGVGKSMIAKRIPSIMPKMNEKEVLETTKIYSVCGLLDKDKPLMFHRPFRAPHTGASDVSLIGGGAKALPGEITLAHNGVLFLDEFAEFKRNVIESLRQPLEDGKITVSRATAKVTYPARFLLVAAMNPCPCGYYGSKKRTCSCTIAQINKYRAKLSGPILDRIDLQVNVPEIDYEKLAFKDKDMDSASMREIVESVVDIQRKRFKDEPIDYNAQMEQMHIERFCSLDDESYRILNLASERFGFSARSYSKILKIARTIADIEQESKIRPSHIKEAISYRILDWDV